MLPAERRRYLSSVNRFTLRVATSQEVREAHAWFANGGAELGVTKLRDLTAQGDSEPFIFADLDRNWWEITSGDGSKES